MSELSALPATDLTLVNTYLDAYLNRKNLAARDIHPRYETLWREIARISGFGKRLRPYMVLLAYRAFGGTEPSRIVPAAVACELLHISMLIHDDIIDRDLLRHNQPTIQKTYETRYAGEVSDPRVRRHNALSAALLAGDLLLSEGRSLITKVEAPAEAVRHAGHAYDEALFEVAGGELLDVESAGAPRGSVDALTVMTYKTAGYSFIGPLLIGSILADAPLATQKILRSFALNLGIAYQLTDDILGIFGSTDLTGKPTDSDIHEGKATYLVERFYALAAAPDVALFERFYGNKEAAVEDCETVRQLLHKTGALAETERAVTQYAAHARSELAQLGIDAANEAAFLHLIKRCTDRSS